VGEELKPLIVENGLLTQRRVGDTNVSRQIVGIHRKIILVILYRIVPHTLPVQEIGEDTQLV
jgi:hypothetical protein